MIEREEELVAAWQALRLEDRASCARVMLNQIRHLRSGGCREEAALKTIEAWCKPTTEVT